MNTTDLTNDKVRKYLEGKLDPEAMYRLEKAALEDPFLAEALEGYGYSCRPVGPQLSILQRQLDERIARQQENKDNFNYAWQRLSVAASAAVLFVLAVVLLWLQTIHSQSMQAPKASIQLIYDPADEVKPVVGWPAYHDYLNTHIKGIPKGLAGRNVSVRFLVGQKGKLSNFEISSGINDAFDDEIIRVIKQGPGWKPLPRAETTEITLHFGE